MAPWKKIMDAEKVIEKWNWRADQHSDEDNWK